MFNSPFGIQLDIKSVIHEIINFMKAEPDYSYRIVVGTDSQLLPNKYADFVTALVIHRVGNGGRYFWRRRELGKFHTLRDRILKEVVFSLEGAQEVIACLEKESDGLFSHNQTPLKWNLEVHADVGENGPTKALIQEVVGMVRGSNFVVKTKPESFAASCVADRHV